MNNSASRYKWHANHSIIDGKVEVTYRENSLCAIILHDGRLGWNVMAYGDARGEGSEGKNGECEWVASTFHTTSKRVVSHISTADAHTSAASSRLNWRPRRFKWTRPFRRKTKSVFCVCVITFQTPSSKVQRWEMKKVRWWDMDSWEQAAGKGSWTFGLLFMSSGYHHYEIFIASRGKTFEVTFEEGCNRSTHCDVNFWYPTTHLL